MEETPEKLDWVIKCADCELKEAFQKLGEAVEEDVNIYNSRFNLQGGRAVVFHTESISALFSVSRRTHAGTVNVVFHQKANEIEIQDEPGAQSLNAIPVLTTNGRCKFQVNGEDMEQWQLRRAALEAIFFRSMPR